MADNLDLGIFAKPTTPAPTPSDDLGIFAKDAPQPTPQEQQAPSAPVVSTNSQDTSDLGIFAKPAEVTPTQQTPDAASHPHMHLESRWGSLADRTPHWVPDAVPPAHVFTPDAPNSIYKDTQLGQIAREYYKERDGTDPGSDAAAIDLFVNDRTWKSANTVSGMKELSYAKGWLQKQASPEQLKRLGFLRQYWDGLPTMFEKGGRDIIPTALKYGVEGTLDPLNLAGGVAGKLLGKGAGVAAGLATSAATNAALDTEGQLTDMATGAQDKFHPMQTAEAGVIGAATHVVGTGLTATLGRVVTPKVLPDPELQAFKVAKVGPTDTPPMQNIQGPVGTFIQGLFDKANPIGTIQKLATGVGKTVKSLKDYTEKNSGLVYPGTGEIPTYPARDPALLPYFQFQRLSSTAYRAQHVFEVGGILPPDPNAPVGTASFRFATSPSLNDAVAPFLPEGDTGNFLLYAAAKRVQQIKNVRNPARIANGLSPISTFFDDPEYWISQGYTAKEAPAQAERLVNKLVAWGDAQPNYPESLVRLKQFTDNTLDYQHQSGLISDASRSNIMQAGGDTAHVPLYPASDAKATLNTAAGIAAAPNAPARARLFGNTGNVAPFLDSIMQSTYKGIRAADTNRFKLSLYDMVDNHKLAGAKWAQGLYEYVPAAERMTMMRVFYDSAKRSMVNAGATVDDDIDRLLTQVNPTTGKNYTADEAMQALLWGGGHTPPDFIDAFGMGGRPKNMENVDMFFRDGNIQFVRLMDKGLINTMKAMRGDADTGGIVNFASNVATKFSKLYGKFVTADPRFVGKNLARDTLSATVNSQFGFKPVASTVNGVYQTWAQNDAYREFLVNGAGGSGMYKSELYDTAAMMERYKKGKVSPSDYMQAVMDHLRNNYLTRGWQGYQDLLEHFEMGPRFNEALAAQKAGMSPLTAAYAGQEVSTNFARSGSWSPVNRYTSWTPFLNAGIQGVYRVGLTAKDNPARTAAMVTGLIMTPMLISHIANSGNPAYDAIPDDVKQSNIWVPIFKDKKKAMDWYVGGGQGPAPDIDRYIPFPAPYDFGGFGAAGNHLYDAIKDHSGAEAANGFFQAFMGMMPGLSVPAVAQLPYHLAINQDWTGTPITPGSVASLPPQDQATESTSELSKMLVQGIEKATRPSDAPIHGDASKGDYRGQGFVPVTPIELDYISNFFMTGILNYIPKVADATIRAQEIGTKGPRATPRADEIDVNNPLSLLTKAWVLPTPNRTSQALTDFYNLKKRVDGLVKEKNLTEKSLMSALDPSGALHNDELKEALAWSKTLTGVTQQLSALRTGYDEIANSTSLTADEKRQQLDENIAKRNAVARQVMLQISSSRDADALTGELFDRNKSFYAKDRQTPGYTWLWNLFHSGKDAKAQTDNMLSK